MRSTRLALKALAGIALGLFCLALAVRKVSYEELLASLAKLDLRYLVAAVVISLVIQLFRAWRWQIELSPLKSLRYPMVWQVVSVAYMSINVLPFRLGEPVRPLLMSWKSGLSVAAIVGNWVFEKMMDAAAMVFFVHLTLLMTDLPPWAGGASGASLLLFLVLLTLVVSYWLGGDKAVDSMLGRLLPAHARSWLQGVLASAREGLSILPDRRMVAVVFVVTLALWFLPILSSYVLILGFGFDLPFAAALVVFVAIGVGTALPNPPGMFGVFQVASVLALGIFGVEKTDALAYGIVLNAVQFFSLVAQGLVAMPFLGAGVGRVTRDALKQPVADS